MRALTQKEREIEELIVRGYDNVEIAGIANLAVKTVQNHARSIFHKREVMVWGDPRVRLTILRHQSEANQATANPAAANPAKSQGSTEPDRIEPPTVSAERSGATTSEPAGADPRTFDT